MVCIEKLLQALNLSANISNLSFTNLCHHTRQLGPNSYLSDLFIAIPGKNYSSKDLVQKALEYNPKAIITDDNSSCYDQINCPVIVVPNVRDAVKILCPIFYPILPDHIVAITGTNGKTSVACLLHQLWQLEGTPNAIVGTLGVISSPSLPNTFSYDSLTTPEAITLYDILNECVQQKINHVAFEASSIAVDQDRIAPLKAHLGIFTNFAEDHLDYHRNLDNYLKAKKRLFTDYVSEQALFFHEVLDADILGYTSKNLKTFCYGLENSNFLGCFTYKILSQQEGGQFVRFTFGEKQWNSFIPLIGEFQIRNLLAALCAFYLRGGDLDCIIPNLLKLGPIKGRLEYVGRYNDSNIYIDYAHTAEALKQALISLRPYTKGKLVVVFGCGGQRDQNKRQIMGAIANQYADFVIVTDDNPRNEDPASIRKSILSNCPKGIEIARRETAISVGMKNLCAGDILLIAGKGHETTQTVGTESVFFSDHVWVHSYLSK